MCVIGGSVGTDSTTSIWQDFVFLEEGEKECEGKYSIEFNYRHFYWNFNDDFIDS